MRWNVFTIRTHLFFFNIKIFYALKTRKEVAKKNSKRETKAQSYLEKKWIKRTMNWNMLKLRRENAMVLKHIRHTDFQRNKKQAVRRRVEKLSNWNEIKTREIPSFFVGFAIHSQELRSRIKKKLHMMKLFFFSLLSFLRFHFSTSFICAFQASSLSYTFLDKYFWIV